MAVEEAFSLCEQTEPVFRSSRPHAMQKLRRQEPKTYCCRDAGSVEKKGGT